MKKFFNYSILALLFAVVFQSCEKENTKPSKLSSEDSIYLFIDELMHEWYLWNDSVPEVDYLNYSEPQQLLNDLMVSIDHWSFVNKKEEINSYFNEGEDFGFGFYLGWDGHPSLDETSMRVILIYTNTDAYNSGIRRGWILQKMNDVNVKEMTSYDDFFSMDEGTMKFTFLDNNNNQQNITLSKEIYNMNAVLYSNTYNVAGSTTGYMVYQSFLGYSKIELEQTIDFFKASDIKELVVDLRYNGGGNVTLAEALANSIIPNSKVGETFFTFMHNDDRSADNDTTIVFRDSERNLNLNRVFFITNSYSASASELVISGLDPHLSVLKIGGKTYGKPVAMYGFEFQDWLAYPVTAKNVNSVGYGDYFNGIEPDKTIVDEYRTDWGDENEPALSQAFYYISHGTFDNSVAQIHPKTALEPIEDGKRFKRNLLLMDR